MSTYGNTTLGSGSISFGLLGRALLCRIFLSIVIGTGLRPSSLDEATGCSTMIAADLALGCGKYTIHTIKEIQKRQIHEKSTMYP